MSSVPPALVPLRYPPSVLILDALRAFAVGSVTVNFLLFLLVSRSQVSLSRSWLREPHRFLEFKSSTERPGSHSLFCLPSCIGTSRLVVI